MQKCINYKNAKILFQGKASKHNDEEDGNSIDADQNNVFTAQFCKGEMQFLSDGHEVKSMIVIVE